MHGRWLTMTFCPRCKANLIVFAAVSRRDSKTEICQECGLKEAKLDLRLKHASVDERKKALKKDREWMKK
jgi:DNA-directed RNA polymerase subunit M/transcription elongation factor TFIIS